MQQKIIIKNYIIIFVFHPSLYIVLNASQLVKSLKTGLPKITIIIRNFSMISMKLCFEISHNEPK